MDNDYWTCFMLLRCTGQHSQIAKALGYPWTPPKLRTLELVFEDLSKNALHRIFQQVSLGGSMPKVSSHVQIQKSALPLNKIFTIFCLQKLQQVGRSANPTDPLSHPHHTVAKREPTKPGTTSADPSAPDELQPTNTQQTWIKQTTAGWTNNYRVGAGKVVWMHTCLLSLLSPLLSSVLFLFLMCHYCYQLLLVAEMCMHMNTTALCMAYDDMEILNNNFASRCCRIPRSTFSTSEWVTHPANRAMLHRWCCCTCSTWTECFWLPPSPWHNICEWHMGTIWHIAWHSYMGHAHTHTHTYISKGFPLLTRHRHLSTSGGVLGATLSPQGF